jgi:hypothetical protein
MCFFHHLTNLLSGLIRGMISLSVRITNTSSVPIITDIVRNIVRFSNESGLNPDLKSSIV